MKLSAYEKKICSSVVNSLDLSLDWTQEMIFYKVQNFIKSKKNRNDSAALSKEIERYIRGKKHIRKQDFLSYFASLDDSSRKQIVDSAVVDIINDCTEYCYIDVIVEKQDIKVEGEYEDNSQAFASIARQVNRLF